MREIDADDFARRHGISPGRPLNFTEAAAIAARYRLRYEHRSDGTTLFEDVPILVDQVRITRFFYERLTPGEQGYASYIQGCWPDSEIPRDNPYAPGSAAAIEWDKGATAAMFAAVIIDSGDE